MNFKVDYRYNIVYIPKDISWEDEENIRNWCRKSQSGDFELFLIYIRYNTDKDLSKFLLKWS